MGKTFSKTTGGVTSVNSRTGKVTMPAVMIMPVKYIFTKEYDFGESVEICDLPANCKVFRIYMSDMLVDPSPSFVADVGTTEDPSKFGLGAYSTSGYMNNGIPKVYEIASATKFILTMQDTFNGNPRTAHLTGQSVDILIEYIENETIS
jgi:hypothetical protein